MSFSPSDISGLKCFEADHLVLSDGDPVSSWASYGTTANFTQTGTNRPTYKTNIVNSLPIVRFDGTNDFLTSDDTGTWGDFFMCVVYKETGTTIAFARLLDKAYDTGSWMGRNETAASTSWGGGVREGTTPYGIFVTQAAASFHILTSRRLGTLHEIYGDGGLKYTENSPGSTALSSAALTAGAETTGSGSFFGGDIAAIFWAQAALTQNQIDQLHNYIQVKYGLTSTQPANWIGSAVTYAYVPTPRPFSWKSGLGVDNVSNLYTTTVGLNAHDFSGSNSGTTSGGVLTFTASNGVRTYRPGAVQPQAAWTVAEATVTTFSGADTTDRVAVGLVNSDDSQWILAWADKHAQTVGVELRTGGTTHSLFSTAATIADGIMVKMVLCGGTDYTLSSGVRKGGYATVWTSADSGATWTRYGGGNVGAYLDMQLKTTLSGFQHGMALSINHGAGGTKTITLAAPYTADYFGYAGVQNIVAVMKSDGSLIQSGSQYYMAFSCGSVTGLGDGSNTPNVNLDQVSFICQGVGLWNSVTNAFTLTSLLFFDDIGGTRTVGNSPASITQAIAGPYSGNWVVLVSTWGETGLQSGAGTVFVRRYIGTTNPLSGVHVLANVSQPIPAAYGSKSYWDFSQLYWDSGASKVRAAMALSASAGIDTPHPVIMEGADLDNLASVTNDTTFSAGEGLHLYITPAGADHYVAANLTQWREYDNAGTIIGTVTPLGHPGSGEGSLHVQPVVTPTGIYGQCFDFVSYGNDPWSHGNYVRYQSGAPLATSAAATFNAGWAVGATRGVIGSGVF